MNVFNLTTGGEQSMFARLSCGCVIITTVGANNHGLSLSLCMYACDHTAEASDTEPGWGLSWRHFDDDKLVSATPITDESELIDLVNKLIFWAADARRYRELTDSLLMTLKIAEARRNERLNIIRSQVKEEFPPVRTDDQG